MTKKNTIGFAIIAALMAFSSAQAAFAGQPSMKVIGKASQPLATTNFASATPANAVRLLPIPVPYA